MARAVRALRHAGLAGEEWTFRLEAEVTANLPEPGPIALEWRRGPRRVRGTAGKSPLRATLELQATLFKRDGVYQAKASRLVLLDAKGGEQGFVDIDLVSLKGSEGAVASRSEPLRQCLDPRANVRFKAEATCHGPRTRADATEYSGSQVSGVTADSRVKRLFSRFRTRGDAPRERAVDQEGAQVTAEEQPAPTPFPASPPLVLGDMYEEPDDSTVNGSVHGSAPGSDRTGEALASDRTAGRTGSDHGVGDQPTGLRTTSRGSITNKGYTIESEQMDKVQSRTNDLLARLATLEGESREKSETIAALSARGARDPGEVAELRAELARRDAAIAALQNGASDVTTAQRDEALQKVSRIEARLKASTAAAERLEGERDAARGRLKALRGEADALVKENNALKDQLNTLKLRLHDRSTRHSLDVEKLEKQLSEATQRGEAIRRESLQREDAIRRESQREDTLRRESDLRRESTDELRRASLEHQAAQRRSVDEKHTQNELQARLERLEKEETAKNEQLQKSLARAEQIESEQAALRGEYEEVLRQNEALRKRVSELEDAPPPDAQLVADLTNDNDVLLNKMEELEKMLVEANLARAASAQLADENLFRLKQVRETQDALAARRAEQIALLEKALSRQKVKDIRDEIFGS